MTDTAPDVADEDAGEPTYFSHRQIMVILGGLMTGMFLASLDQSIVGTASPASRPTCRVSTSSAGS